MEHRLKIYNKVEGLIEIGSVKSQATNNLKKLYEFKNTAFTNKLIQSKDTGMTRMERSFYFKDR